MKAITSHALSVSFFANASLFLQVTYREDLARAQAVLTKQLRRLAIVSHTCELSPNRANRSSAKEAEHSVKDTSHECETVSKEYKCSSERAEESRYTSERAENSKCSSEGAEEPKCASEKTEEPRCASEKKEKPRYASENAEESGCTSEQVQESRCALEWPDESLFKSETPDESLYTSERLLESGRFLENSEDSSLSPLGTVSNIPPASYVTPHIRNRKLTEINLSLSCRSMKTLLLTLLPTIEHNCSVYGFASRSPLHPLTTTIVYSKCLLHKDYIRSSLEDVSKRLLPTVKTVILLLLTPGEIEVNFQCVIRYMNILIPREIVTSVVVISDTHDDQKLIILLEMLLSYKGSALDRQVLFL